MVNLMLGNCLDKLKELEDNSVDSIVTDPPYHLVSIVKRFGKEGSAPAKFGTDGIFTRSSKGFMGKEWDGVDGNGMGISYNVDMWKECLRVLKPGGHLLSFGGTRTYHRMTTTIEDAGFEIRDMIEWVYGSGFPKSFNIGKGIDKKEGNERIVVSKDKSGKSSRAFQSMENTTAGVYEIDKGTSKFEGWGSALKPAHEPICLARKPLSEKTIVDNVLKWGTGGINIDISRIEYTNGKPESGWSKSGSDGSKGYLGTNTFKQRKMTAEEIYKNVEQGRFPANFIHDGSEEVMEVFDKAGILKGSKGTGLTPTKARSNFNSSIDGINRIGYDDSGSAARYFKSIIYQSKSSKKEKNEGLEDFEDKTIWNDKNKYGLEKFNTLPKKNNHPTTKPVALMEYLINMITPTQGIVLDPFTGSGSTGVAAVKNNFSFIGIEMDEDYIKIAEARINHFKK